MLILGVLCGLISHGDYGLRSLGWWLGLALVSVVLLTLALAVPRLRDRDRFGIPRPSKHGNLVGGLAAGLMTWVDLP